MSWALFGGVGGRISLHYQHKLELVIRTLSSLRSILPIVFSISVALTPFFQLFSPKLQYNRWLISFSRNQICFFRKSFDSPLKNLTICRWAYWYQPGPSHHLFWIIAIDFVLVPWFCLYFPLVYFQCRGQTDLVEHGSDYVTPLFRILYCLPISFRKSLSHDL